MAIRARYAGKELLFELAPGQTLHERLSTELDIDPVRLKLLCKGKNYSSVLPATATAQLIAHCREGAVVTVMGTPHAHQLDRPISLRERIAKIVSTLSVAGVATWAHDLLVGVLSWVWLFVTSIFVVRKPLPPARRGGGQPARL